MAVAAVRGHIAGTPLKSLIRLDQPLFYYPLLGWGFLSALREQGVSRPRVERALVTVALAFVGYMGFERLTPPSL